MSDPEVQSPATEASAATSLGRLRDNLALGLAGIALLAAVVPWIPGVFETRVRDYLLHRPQILAELNDAYKAELRTKTREQEVQAIKDHHDALFKDPRDPVLGNPNGSIVMVEFFDYNCGFCKLAAPELVKILKDNPDVKVVMKELPILGAPSELAARASLAAHRLKAYSKVHFELIAQKPVDDTAIIKTLGQAGLSLAQVQNIANDDATTRQINDVKALAKKIGLESTPAFIIGDTVIHGADMNQVRLAIQKERQAKKPS